MRSVLALLAVAALGAVALSTPAASATRGFPVGGFDQVRTSIPYDVRVHVGGAPSVTADGPQTLLDRLDVHVEGGALVLRTQGRSWWSGWRPHPGERLLVSVTLPRLKAVGLSGSGNLDVDRARAGAFDADLSGPGNIRIGQLEAGRAVLNLSGSGDLVVAGRVGQAMIDLSGSGNVRAQKLGIGDLDVSLSGPGDVDATVFGTATGHLSGPGDIRIGGHPRCQIGKSGPGDVHCG